MENAVAIIQIRMSSTRLPGKAMKLLCGKPVLEHIVERVSASKSVSRVVLATSTSADDDLIQTFANACQIPCFRGSLDNVLERFYLCAKAHYADVVVRLTGDNALVDGEIIDAAVQHFQDSKSLDYLYYKQGLPLGMAVEVFRFTALERAYREATGKACIEHVTPYLYQNPQLFQVERFDGREKSYSHYRWTLDTGEDWHLIEALYGYLYHGKHDFHYHDILAVMEAHPELCEINKDVEQKKLSAE